MNSVTRDQVLRGALDEITRIIDPSKKDLVAARRAREVAVKALFATREPDPLAFVAGQLMALVDEMGDELEAARRAAAAGEMWACGHVPPLVNAARLAFRDARAAGIKLPGKGGPAPEIQTTGPL